MNRTTVSRRAVASVLLVAAGIGMATVPAAADEEAGAVTGTVWFDRDGDKTRDAGEPGRPNAVVEVRQNDVLRTTVTADGDGRYTIPGLAPGDYTLRNASGDGYTKTTPETVDVTVADGGKQVDFGLQGGRLVGSTWRDDNGDGVRQSGDKAMRMSGDQVRLDAIMWETRHATIDAQGKFVFEDLPNLDTFRVYPPNRTAKGDEFTVAGKDSVMQREISLSPLLEVKNNQQLDVGVGYRALGADLALSIDMPTAVKVGVPFTVTGNVLNQGAGTDHFEAQVRLPRGVRFVSMAGMTRTPSMAERLVNGMTDQPVASGASADFSFTLVADKPVDANLWLGAGPAKLRDWNTSDNTQENRLVVTGANTGATTPPAAQPVVADKTPAAKAKAPAKESVEVKDLASTGASPVLPLILGSVLLAAGGALLFVLRRRASQR
jgi:LPXTG-motif cell wall-anchored protein